MARVRKRKIEEQSKYCVYAYEFDDSLIPNEGDLMEINQKLSNAMESTWEDAKSMVSHFFQNSGTNSIDTATASTVGFYSGGLVGALVAGSAERAAACFNCHVGEQVSQSLSQAIDMIVAPSDSAGN
jgi:hypothetical protein